MNTKAVNKKNVIIFGSSGFTVPLISSMSSYDAVNLLYVVTGPDKAQGRGYAILPNPVRKYCTENNIDVRMEFNVNSPEFIEEINSSGADFVIVASFGRILSARLIGTKPAFINVHPSLLPKYRGATPIQTALKNGDVETGVTLFNIVEDLDAGPMIAQRQCAIEKTDNFGELSGKLAVIGAELVRDYIDFVNSGLRRKGIFDPPLKQNDDDATFTSKIEKQDCLVDWSNEAYIIHNKIRSLSPDIGVFTFINGQTRIKIFNSYVYDSDYAGDEAAGTVKFVIKKGPIVVKCENSLIALTALQFPGKRVMTSAEIANGRRIKIGDIMSDEKK